MNRCARVGLGAPQRKSLRQKQRTTHGIRTDTIFLVTLTPPGASRTSEESRSASRNTRGPRQQKSGGALCPDKLEGTFTAPGGRLAHGWRPERGAPSPTRERRGWESGRGRRRRAQVWHVERGGCPGCGRLGQTPPEAQSPPAPGRPAPTSRRGTGRTWPEGGRPLSGRRGGSGRAAEFCLHGDRAGSANATKGRRPRPTAKARKEPERKERLETTP